MVVLQLTKIMLQVQYAVLYSTYQGRTHTQLGCSKMVLSLGCSRVFTSQCSHSHSSDDVYLTFYDFLKHNLSACSSLLATPEGPARVACFTLTGLND